MSNNNEHTSDVEKAAQQVDVQEVEKNLQQKDSKQVDKPEALDDDQKTPFIDEDIRTDKK